MGRGGRKVEEPPDEGGMPKEGMPQLLVKPITLTAAFKQAVYDYQSSP
tara:strand:- start:3099 stop:3242 length:144 start_codon:yes stop_codon:yes gene_type:complete